MGFTPKVTFIHHKIVDMKKILVPTDFSKNALKAITYAAEVALKTGGTVYLVHAIEPSVNMASMQSDSHRPTVLKDRSSKLKIARDTVALIYPGLKVMTQLLGGNTIDGIVNFSEKENIDLIIMGTTGASGLKKFFMGSMASGTIAASTIPVLTVPASYTPEEPANILFATNHFEKDKNILEPVMDISKLFSASVHVVVFKEKDGDKDANLIYNEEQLNDYLHFLKENYPLLSFKGELLEGDDFETSLDAYNHQQDIDLIAMVTYQKSLWEKLLKRSATKQMSFHSTIPLLAIPANYNTVGITTQ